MADREVGSTYLEVAFIKTKGKRFNFEGCSIPVLCLSLLGNCDMQHANMAVVWGTFEFFAIEHHLYHAYAAAYTFVLCPMSRGRFAELVRIPPTPPTYQTAETAKQSRSSLQAWHPVVPKRTTSSLLWKPVMAFVHHHTL